MNVVLRRGRGPGPAFGDSDDEVDVPSKCRDGRPRGTSSAAGWLTKGVTLAARSIDHVKEGSLPYRYGIILLLIFPLDVSALW